MTPVDNYPKLLPGNFYHIYNRANGSEKLFFQNRNYDFFLKRYADFLSPYLETFAYCLLQNHFHLLVRIHEEERIAAAVAIGGRNSLLLNPDGISRSIDHPAIVAEQFRKFFISYSKSINVQENRTGNLFQKKFKRKLISHPRSFKHVVYYIHHQPSHHGYQIEDLDYPHSSYLSFVSEKKSKLMREDVMKWFDGKNGFEKFHHEKQDLKFIEQFLIEED